MGIFDIFGSSDQQAAAAAQQQGLNTGYSQLSGLLGQGRGAINTATGTALGDISANSNTGLNSISSSLANSTAPFATNLAVGQAGQNAYANATGVNGAAGNASALANFNAGPGYQFNMDQQMQNLLRTQEATGQGNSGATNVDTLTQASGLANQGWQQYVQNLSPFLTTSNQAAAGIAGANATAAGQTNTNLANTTGSQLAALTNQGNQTNQSYTTQGNAAYGTQTGIGNAQANADMAPYTASQNFWNLAQNLAGDAATVLGGKKPTTTS